MASHRSIILPLVLTMQTLASAATISLTDNPSEVVGNGTKVGGGLIGGQMQFSTSITASNAQSGDSAAITSQDSRITTWINDGSFDQQQWQTTFDLDFMQPLDNLRIMPYSPPNNSDNVSWTISWEASSNVASFVNSPATVGEYSLYNNGGRIESGLLASGVSFRMDDDGSPSLDVNGTDGGDLNIQVPSQPWSIDLPDGVTAISISSEVVDGANRVHAREGFGVDFSNVIVPEPSSMVWPLILFVTALFIRRR